LNYIWVDLILLIIAHMMHVLYVIYSHVSNFKSNDELIKILFPYKNLCCFDLIS